MSDPLRTDVSRAIEPASESDRDAKIEQLLLGGLDHYFAGEYERAIDVWTRAFFLDRSHARARAYIERARSALAERQRESEELLQNGVAAFHRGEGAEARRLLQAAIIQGAPPDEAFAVLDRLNRLEQGLQRPSGGDQTGGDRAGAPTFLVNGRRSARRVGLALSAVVGIVVVAAVFGAREPRWAWWAESPGGPTSATPLPSPSSAGLPLPRRGETALTRAQGLISSGRLRDALGELELVRLTDPQRPIADRLRADIQKQLIAIASATSRSSARPPTDSRLP